MQYDAFVSYSQAADARLSEAIQRGLELLAKPWNRRRALRVFRDEAALAATPSMWTDIESALLESRYFVLLASPQAATSKAVAREIRTWLSVRSPDTLIVVQTDGELFWDQDRSEFDALRSTALPSELIAVHAAEPLHPDLRWARSEDQLDMRHGRFRAQIAAIAAPIHGVAREDLEGEDVRQFRRTRRLAWSAGLALLVLTLLSIATAALAISNENSAAWERRQALREQHRAEENAVNAARQRQRALASAKIARANARLARRNSQIAENNARDADNAASAVAKANASLVAANSQLVKERDRANSGLLDVTALSVAAQATSNQDVQSPDAKLLMAAEASQLRDNINTYTALAQTVMSQNALRSIIPRASDVAVSSDGSLIAVQEEQGSRVSIWRRGPSVRDHSLVRTLDPGIGTIGALTFDSGHHIGAVGFSGLAVIDADTGATTRQLADMKYPSAPIRFLPDGRTLEGVVTPLTQADIFKWDSQTGTPPTFYPFHLGTQSFPYRPKAAAAFSPDGDRLVTVETQDDSSTGRFIEVQITYVRTSTTSVLYSTRDESATDARGDDFVRFSRDGTQIVVVTPGNANELTTLDSATGEVVSTRAVLDQSEIVVGVSDDGDQIGYFNPSVNALSVRSARNGAAIGQPVRTSSGNELVFGPAPTDLIVFGGFALDYDRSPVRNPLVDLLFGPTAVPNAVAISPHGRFAATKPDGGDTVVVRDLATGQDDPVIDARSLGKIRSIAVDDAGHVALKTDFGNTGRLSVLDRDSRVLWSMNVSPYGLRVDFTTDDRAVLVDDVGDIREFDSLTGRPVTANDACLQSRGMAVVKRDGNAGTPYCTPDELYIVDVRPAGRAEKADPGAVALYRSSDGEQVSGATPRGGLRYDAIAIRADSQVLAVADESDRTYLYALPSLQEIGEIPDVPVDAMAFDSDGNLVIGGGSEVFTPRNSQVVRVLIGRSALLDRACQLAGRGPTQLEWRRLFADVVDFQPQCGQPLQPRAPAPTIDPASTSTQVLAGRLTRPRAHLPPSKSDSRPSTKATRVAGRRTSLTHKQDNMPEDLLLYLFLPLLATLAVLFLRRRRPLPLHIRH